MFTANSRSAVLTTVWIGGLSLPFLIFAIRAGFELFGWMTAFYMITYGPLLLIISIVLGVLTHFIPKDLPPTSQLWRPIAGFLVWFTTNVFAVGFVISDLTDQEDTPGPLSALIPPGFQMPVAGIILLIGLLGVIFMVETIFKLRRKYNSFAQNQAK